MRLDGRFRRGVALRARAPLAGALLAIGAAAPLGAQDGRPCDDCSAADVRRQVEAEASAQAREAAREAAREIKSLRRDIARLSRKESDAELKRALREADSALDRVKLEKGAPDPALSRALQRLATARAGAAVQPGDQYGEIVQRLAALHAQLTMAAVHRSFDAMGRAQAMRGELLARREAQRGWLGVSISGDPPGVDAERGRFFHYRSYPVIDAVDAGSPAAAAGLEAGDTIVAFGGRDVRNRKIYLSEVLRPGSKLMVRVRRDGRTREAKVAIREHPMPDPGTDFVIVDGGPALAGPRRPTAPTARRGVPRVAPVPGDPPPMALLPGPGAFIWSGPSAVAGAELTRMNADLRDALGAPDGVLVLSVGRGSPASSAGIRAGDVILRVGNHAVTSPGAVQRAVQDADGRHVEVEVMRKSERRKVMLKW